MPTYQYECDACGHSFDVLQSMTDKRLKKCPKCAKSTLHRLIGAGAGVIFKGSGFYETDYKRPVTGSESAKSAVKSNTSEKKPNKTKDKNGSSDL